MKREDIKTIVDLFLYISEQEPYSVFKVREGNGFKAISNKEFVDDVLASSFTLKDRLDGQRNKVALIGQNSYEWVVSYFSIIVSGNIPVLIDKSNDKDTINSLLSRTNSRFIIYSKDYEESVIDSLLDKLEFNQLKSSEPLSLDNVSSWNEEEIVSILFTSGSTGVAKIVPLSNKNMISLLFAIDKSLDLQRETILALPFHHTFGLNSGLLYAMSIKATGVINDSLRRLPLDFRFSEPDYVLLVPGLLKMVMQFLSGDYSKENIRKIFGERLRTIVLGGAPLTVNVKPLVDAGIVVINGYGLTETTSALCVHYLKGEEGEEDNIGHPFISALFRIEENREIVVKGSTIFKGYLDSEIDNKDVFTEDGYYRTGDLGYIDQNGEVHIDGRLKNLIILPNGENIPAEKLETIIYKLPYVKEAVVTEYNGNITALIFSEDIELAKSKIDEDLNSINKVLPINQNITSYYFKSKEFDKTAAGKIVRKLALNNIIR